MASSDVARPTTIRLIRHGETLSYAIDAALTERGRAQAHRRGVQLAEELAPGCVRILHSPRRRAAETARHLRRGLRDRAAAKRLPVVGPFVVTDPIEAAAFDNFRTSCGTEELEVTAAFGHLEAERHRRTTDGSSSPPAAWVLEADRFWHRFETDDDPIAYWLAQPLQSFEPAALVVHRFWDAIVDWARTGGPEVQTLVCTHSGPIRALVAQAIGADPGEPDHLEDVRLDVDLERSRVGVRYRAESVEIGLPNAGTPSWFPPAR